jgi:hypothetical protein
MRTWASALAVRQHVHRDVEQTVLGVEAHFAQHLVFLPPGQLYLLRQPQSWLRSGTRASLKRRSDLIRCKRNAVGGRDTYDSFADGAVGSAEILEASWVRRCWK